MHIGSHVTSRTYKPYQRHELGFLRTWVVLLNNFVESRELIWQLFKRDFFAAYKKSFLGIAWIVVSPVASILAWVFLQKAGMLHPGELGVPYPAYVLIGTSMWQLFVGMYRAGESTLLAGQTFVLQVQYPHEVLLFKETAQYLANFLVAFILNILALLIYGIDIKWQIIFFPLVALPLFCTAAAIGLISAMLSVVALDVSKAMNMVWGLAMWTVPIVYSDTVPNSIVQEIVRWNPLTYLVCSARDIILYGRVYNLTGFLICSGLSILFFLLSWRLFYISEDRVIERML